MKKSRHWYGVIVLGINLANIAFVNYVAITAMILRNIQFGIPLTIFMGYVYCLAQFAVLGDVERSFKAAMIFSGLWIVQRLKKTTNLVDLNSMYTSILVIHSVAYLVYLTAGYSYGRAKSGGFAGFFDEASVLAFVLGTMLLVCKPSHIKAFITVGFLLLSKSLAAQAYVVFYLILALDVSKSRHVQVVCGIFVAAALAIVVFDDPELRLNKEVLPAITAMADFTQVDMTQRPSSSGARLLHEASYLRSMVMPFSIESIFGGHYFPERTASLNAITAWVLHLGLLGFGFLLAAFFFSLKPADLDVRRLCALVLLVFASGAVLKPIFIFTLAVIFIGGQSRLDKRQHHDLQ